MAKKQSPALFHNCPYFGVYAAVNLTTPREMLTFYPSGYFMVKFAAKEEKIDLFKLHLEYNTK